MVISSIQRIGALPSTASPMQGDAGFRVCQRLIKHAFRRVGGIFRPVVRTLKRPMRQRSSSAGRSPGSATARTT